MSSGDTIPVVVPSEATRRRRQRLLVELQGRRLSDAYLRPDIRAGGFASATFVGASRPALAVPETAVRYDADGAAVMLVGADDKVLRAPVRTGQRGGGYVELVTGPPAGSRVVQKAAAMLVPGDIIRPAGAS